MRVYQQAQLEGVRMYEMQDVMFKLKQVFFEMTSAIERRVEHLHWMKQLAKIGTQARDYISKEWMRAVRSTLGIDLSQDYYNGDFYSDEVNKWLSDSLSRVQSIPTNLLDNLQDILHDGFVNGKAIPTLAEEISEEFGLTKRRAELLARDQIGTLNAKLTQRQHEDAGVERYIWEDSNDERVRPCHRELHGKMFDYKNPPEMWYVTKSRGVVMTGRHCNPGEDYNCRCVATPVFDWEELDLPIGEDSSSEKS